MNQYNIIIFLNFVEIFGVLLFLHSYLARRDKKESLIYDPLIFFILGSVFVYLIVPLFMSIFGWSWHKITLTEESYFKAHIYVYSYISIVIVTYLSILHITKEKINTSPIDTFYRLTINQNYILIFLFLVPILLDTIYLLVYVFSFDFAYYLKNRIILRKGMGAVILVSYMGTLIVPIFFANLLVKIRHKNKIHFSISIIMFSLFILLPFLTAYVVMSNRLTALILLIMLILIYIVVMEKKFTFAFYFKLLFGLIGLFLFFVFIGYMRSIHGDFGQINVGQMIEVLGLHAEHAIVGNFGNFEHLVWLFDNFYSWEFLYGITFVAAFLNIIPRFLLEDKLLGGGPHLKNMIHPGSYDLAGENITSYTTGVVVEGYMNFGIAGIIILAVCHAVTLVLLKKLSYNIKGNILLLSLYLYLIFSITFLMIFGEFLGIYTRTLVVSMPFVIFYIVMNKPSRSSR